MLLLVNLTFLPRYPVTVRNVRARQWKTALRSPNLISSSLPLLSAFVCIEHWEICNESNKDIAGKIKPSWGGEAGFVQGV